MYKMYIHSVDQEMMLMPCCYRWLGAYDDNSLQQEQGDDLVIDAETMMMLLLITLAWSFRYTQQQKSRDSSGGSGSGGSGSSGDVMQRRGGEEVGRCVHNHTLAESVIVRS